MVVKMQAGTPEANQTPGKTPKSVKRKNKVAGKSPGSVDQMKEATPKAANVSKTPKGSKRKLQDDATSPAAKVQAVTSPAGKPTPAGAHGTPKAAVASKTPKKNKIPKEPKNKLQGDNKSPATKVEASRTPTLAKAKSSPKKKKKNRRLDHSKRLVLKKARQSSASEQVIAPTKFIVKFNSHFISLKDPVVKKVLEVLSSAKTVSNSKKTFRVCCSSDAETCELISKMKTMPGNKKFVINE